jgi:uncharacterized membrane protein YciS (DUF1049 family)
MWCKIYLYGFVFSALVALLLYVSLNEQIERQQKQIEILEDKIEAYEDANNDQGKSSG